MPAKQTHRRAVAEKTPEVGAKDGDMFVCTDYGVMCRPNGDAAVGAKMSLLNEIAAVDFAKNAFGHLKARRQCPCSTKPALNLAMASQTSAVACTDSSCKPALGNGSAS
jgi:hypothetical protein